MLPSLMALNIICAALGAQWKPTFVTNPLWSAKRIATEIRYAKTLREALMLMARLWPFFSAFVAIDFWRPTLERNHLWKCVTHSTHSSAEICSRSNTGANSAGVAPRFPVRICRAVQSSSCRYSPSPSDRQPLFEARRLVCFARTT